MENVINSPLSIVNEIFISSRCSEKEFTEAVEAKFASLDRSAIPRIVPGMDVSSIPDNSLVIITGMVQDLPNPELYIGVAMLPDGKLHTTKYSDGSLAASLAFSAPGTKLWDRKPCVLIPTPSSPSPSRPDEALVYLYEPFKGQPPMLHDRIEVLGILCKPSQGHSSQSCCHDHKGDIAMEEDQNADIEEGEEDDEALAHVKAFGSLPRIHAILCSKPTAVDLNQDASSALGSLTLGSDPRATAVKILTNALGGDALAAEYLLLLSLERVTSRASDLPLGIAPMNLTGCPSIQGPEAVSSFARGLQLALSSLLPLTNLLPISVHSCNTGDVSLELSSPSSTDKVSWVPKRLSNSPRVTRSPLQLPKGTFLLLDETVLTEGKLDEQGLVNLQALAKMIQGQTLEFEFEQFKHSVPMEICPVVLSNGRSILKDALSIQVPLRATREERSEPEVDERSISAAKAYLDHVSTRINYELTDAVRKDLVDEFVKSRQVDPTFTAESFQAQLTLARACALSFGESELSMERWSYVKEMERLRAERLRVV